MSKTKIPTRVTCPQCRKTNLQSNVKITLTEKGPLGHDKVTFFCKRCNAHVKAYIFK